MIHSHLKSIVDQEAMLCTDGASYYKSFAQQKQIAHHRFIILDKQHVIGKELPFPTR